MHGDFEPINTAENRVESTDEAMVLLLLSVLNPR